MLDLDTIRLVTLQFSFSNPRNIPAPVPEMPEETVDEHLKRKNQSGGVTIIQPLPNCSIVALPGELEEVGYEMVAAGWQLRHDYDFEGDENSGLVAKEIKRKRTWYMVRFRYAQREHAYSREEFLAKRDAIRAGLDEMCLSALWRMRAFLKDRYLNGVLIPSLSINLVFRSPLFGPNGKPIMVPLKDAEGVRIGQELLRAEHYFHL